MTPDSSLTEAEWAWCAGLFEGEGNIRVQPPTTIELRVVSTDPDVLEGLDALWPSPSGVRKGRVTVVGKQSYYWTVCSKSRSQGFLVGIYPWLGKRRRARADEALELLARNSGRRARVLL